MATQRVLRVFEPDPDKYKHVDPFYFWSEIGLKFSSEYPVTFEVDEDDKGITFYPSYLVADDDETRDDEEYTLLDVIDYYLSVEYGSRFTTYQVIRELD